MVYGLLSFKRHSQAGRKARFQVAYHGLRYCSLKPRFAHIAIIGFDPLIFDQAHCRVRKGVLADRALSRLKACYGRRVYCRLQGGFQGMGLSRL